MSVTDWEQQYINGDMPWNKDAPSPGLVGFLKEHPPEKERTVVVPGCGLGHDVKAFADAGWDATGYDISETAMKLAGERVPDAKFVHGNFLYDGPERQFDWVFEHTFFCAIQPDERSQYVEAVRRWLKPGGHYLAVYYLIDDMDGPPFGTTREEILGLFSPRFTRLKDWVPRSYPNREGLEWMVLWRLF